MSSYGRGVPPPSLDHLTVHMPVPTSNLRIVTGTHLNGADPAVAATWALRFRVRVKWNRVTGRWHWAVTDGCRRWPHGLMRTGSTDTWELALAAGLTDRNQVEQAWAWGEIK